MAAAHGRKQPRLAWKRPGSAQAVDFLPTAAPKTLPVHVLSIGVVYVAVIDYRGSHRDRRSQRAPVLWPTSRASWWSLCGVFVQVSVVCKTATVTDKICMCVWAFSTHNRFYRSSEACMSVGTRPAPRQLQDPYKHRVSCCGN